MTARAIPDSPLSVKRLWPMLVIVVPCVLLALAGNAARSFLQFDRVAILDGQIWRIFTGNWVHLGWGHLGEDMAGYVLLWLLFEREMPGWRCPILVVLGSLGVGFGLLLGDPALRWYVGISGALNTLWIAGAMLLMARRDWLGWVLALFLVLKLVYEQLLGPLPWSAATTGGPVVVDAHLWGALSGAVLGAAVLLWSRWRNTRDRADRQV
ncbi:MAG TPA: rhombosortase [Gammaproteobacteria bacterium]|nr:rhombosortase [Gammaproteobacteria bacterium]